jgi:hypothetical protein
MPLFSLQAGAPTFVIEISDEKGILGPTQQQTPAFSTIHSDGSK